MPRRSPSPPDETPSRRRPASTPEDREAQIISDAYDLAEYQIQNRTASAQVITHFLKLGSTREQLEQEKIKLEMKKLDAQVVQIEQGARMEELFTDAIKAIRSYQGVQEAPQESIEEDYDNA